MDGVLACNSICSSAFIRKVCRPKRYGTLLHNVGLNGYYWCKSLDTSGSSSACYVYFSQNVVLRNYYDRYYGFTVRPVCP